MRLFYYLLASVFGHQRVLPTYDPIQYGKGMDFGSIQYARKRTRRAKSARRFRSCR